MVRIILIVACSVVMAAAGIFGTFYDPGHPWMDTKRRIGILMLCLAGAVELCILALWH